MCCAAVEKAKQRWSLQGVCNDPSALGHALEVSAEAPYRALSSAERSEQMCKGSSGTAKGTRQTDNKACLF